MDSRHNNKVGVEGIECVRRRVIVGEATEGRWGGSNSFDFCLSKMGSHQRVGAEDDMIGRMF